jgi:hypothetical protein
MAQPPWLWRKSILKSKTKWLGFYEVAQPTAKPLFFPTKFVENLLLLTIALF